MRKLREIFRLHFEAGLSRRAIARALLVSTTTVGDYLSRFERAGLRWPLDPELSEVELERLLFPPNQCSSSPNAIDNFEFDRSIALTRSYNPT